MRLLRAARRHRTPPCTQGMSRASRGRVQAVLCLTPRPLGEVASPGRTCRTIPCRPARRRNDGTPHPGVSTSRELRHWTRDDDRTRDKQGASPHRLLHREQHAPSGPGVQDLRPLRGRPTADPGHRDLISARSNHAGQAETRSTEGRLELDQPRSFRNDTTVALVTRSPCHQQARRFARNLGGGLSALWHCAGLHARRATSLVQCHSVLPARDTPINDRTSNVSPVLECAP
jgi:hypothetical protein